MGDDGLRLDVAQRTTLQPEVGFVLLGQDGALGLDLGRFKFGLALLDFLPDPIAGSLEVVAGLPEEACAFPLDRGLPFLDFELGGALEVAHFVDDVGTEPGGEEVELEDFVADLEFSVFLDVAEIRREPEAARGDAGAGEGGFGGDGVSDFGGVGLDVLLDDRLPFAVEFGGFFLNLLCGRFNDGGFLLDDGLACRQGFLAEFLGLVEGFAAEFLALGDGFGSERFGLGPTAAAAASAFSFAVCSSSPASVSTLSIRPGVSG